MAREELIRYTFGTRVGRFGVILFFVQVWRNGWNFRLDIGSTGAVRMLGFCRNLQKFFCTKRKKNLDVYNPISVYVGRSNYVGTRTYVELVKRYKVDIELYEMVW